MHETRVCAGAAPEPPRPADYLTPYLPLAAAVGACALSPAEAADARDKCLQARTQPERNNPRRAVRQGVRPWHKSCQGMGMQVQPRRHFL